MNKIYKVVWSKVKNCYVVVSEIAKNVITGAVKSAKVGSSVAMGAAMAFVITGSAYASDLTINATGDQTGLSDSVSGSILVDSTYNNDGKLTINSDGKGIAAYQNGMTVTVKGLELNSKDTTAMLVAGDHANASLTVNAEGNVNINGTGEVHGIAVKSQGGSATINAADINVNVTENGVYAREDGAFITLNGTNVTVESTGMQTDAGKGHAVYVDQNAQVDITATNDVTLKAVDGKYAIGINGGEDLVKDAVVTVKAGNNVDIDGQVFARQEATVNIEGTNVTVDTGSKDAISVSGGTVNVTAAEALRLTSDQNDGVQVVEGTAKLQAKDVVINAGNWGVKATLDKGGNIDVTADTIKVTGENGGIYNEGKNGVALNADNGVEVTGKVYVNYGGSVNVDAGAGDVTINGDVDAAHGTSVNVSGQNVTLAATGADAIQGVATTVNITASEKITITSDKKDGIESCASTVSLNAKDVEITSGAWGVVGTGDAGTDIDINAETIKINGAKGGIRNLADSDITVTATDKVEVTGNVLATGGGLVTLDATNQVKVAGNIDTAGAGLVTLNADKDVTVNGTVQGNFNVNAETLNITATGKTAEYEAYGLRAQSEKAYLQSGNRAPQNNEVNVKDLIVNSEGMAVSVQGAHLTVNAETVKLTSDDGGIYVNAYPNGNPNGPNITVEEGAGSVTMNVTKELTINAGGNGVSFASSNPDKKVNITGTAEITINADGNGVYTRGNNSPAKDNAINITGSKVTVTSTGIDEGETNGKKGHAVFANGSAINIFATDSIELTAIMDGKNAIYANKGNGDDNYGKVVIGSVNVAKAIGSGNISKADVIVNGDITAEDKSSIIVDFATDDSILRGNVNTATEANTTLSFGKGATWKTDAMSTVTNLDVDGAKIVIDNAQAGSIKVGTLTGTGMNVELASGEAEVGTIVADMLDVDNDGVADEKDDIRVSVTTNGVNMSAAAANKEGKYIVKTAAGMGLVDEIDAKDTCITGDVIFKDDGNGFKVVSTTLNGDVNVTGTINGVDVTNAAGLERNAESKYYQTTTIEGKTTIDSMGRVYTNHVFADQAIVVGDHSTLDSTGLYVGKNFKVDKETGDVEAGKVNGAEISDYMFNGVVLDKDGDVFAKDVMATGGITAIGNITSLQGVKAAGGKFVVDGATGNVTGGTYNGVNVENLKDQVDANIGRIENVENRVTENEFAISQNKQDIATNAEKIETNNKLIAENRDAIADNAFNIESNKQAIADNEVAIETNKDAIEANKQAIEANKDAIEANKDAIEANKQAIETNKADIAANKQAIADEAAAREAADKALSDAIDNVAGDIADTKAQVEANKADIADNKAAIEQNAQDLANEVADRVAADNKLQQKLDKESVDRQIADAQERAERAQADQELQNAIDAEEQARKDADAAEAKARSEEDQRIESKFDGEVNRLDNRIDKVDAKIDKVGAMAAAMASLKTMGYDPEAPTEIAVGIGQYRNETGIAIGAFHYPNKNFMLNFSLSTAGDEVMGGIGATWKIGRKR